MTTTNWILLFIIGQLAYLTYWIRRVFWLIVAGIRKADAPRKLVVQKAKNVDVEYM